MIWDQLTSKQIAEMDKNIPVFLTLAATEQHGPHLPLATDRLIGEHFAYTLNESLNKQILILPSMGIGCSDHHMEFPGTLTLSHQTFSLMVKEIIESVMHHGFNKIILFNSHGGNQGITQVIIEELGYKYPHVHIAAATWWRLAGDALREITESGPGGSGHACELETSIIQLIADHLIDKEPIQKGGNIPTYKWAEGDMLHSPSVSYYRSMKEMTKNGTYGDPTKASAEKGKLITDCVVMALKQLATDLYNAKEK